MGDPCGLCNPDGALPERQMLPRRPDHGQFPVTGGVQAEQPGADEELREALADELGGWQIGSGYYTSSVLSDDARDMADALLPVVTAWADRRAAHKAADELQAAARDFNAMASPTLAGDPFIRASDWAARILRARNVAGPGPDGRLCLCGRPEADSVHHRPQTSDEEHAYEPAPTAAEFYGAAAVRPTTHTDEEQP